jgi:drug/metabolite transporter (DMT)-like permease
VISLVLAGLSALAYGLAPVIYRPALACTSQYRAVNVFSLFSIAAGFLLPWRAVEPFGVAAVASAALLGGVVGSWLYISAVKVGGASVGNISSSLYIVLLPLFAWKIHLVPAAALVLLGLAVASWGDEGSRRGALYGVLAAFVWAVSINFYREAVESLGPGGALFMRGVVVFLTSLYLGRGGPVCKILRLIAGGFIDTFIGFGSYTLAVSLGDYVLATLVMSTYPLVTAVAERPFRRRKALGALLAVAGLASATR